MSKTKILIIEDEPDISEMIEYNLQENGFDTDQAFNGADGLDKVLKFKPDLILLDIMLPELDGFEVCKRLRAMPQTCDIPIIILSAKSQETDKVVGLELGADDYVTKPFSPRELSARIKAVMRRSQISQSPKQLIRGNIRIEAKKHKVFVSGEEVNLTRTEFNLLKLLAGRPGIVFSRNKILDSVFNDAIVIDRTVDAHIKSLRKKLGNSKDSIETIRGIGYRFKEL
jgi:DNA-binding response OmpR family regulator